MMDSIRRRLYKSPAKDLWSTDLTLEPEISEVSELRLDNTVLLAASNVKPGPQSNDVELKGYYRGLILAAIRQGGNYRGQQISVPWLRMTLAGLEMRPIPPEMMWEGEPEGLPTDMHDYERLFPEETVAQ